MSEEYKTNENLYEGTESGDKDTVDSACAEESSKLGGLEQVALEESEAVRDAVKSRGLMGFVSGAIFAGAMAVGINEYSEEPAIEQNVIPDEMITDIGYVSPGNIKIVMNDSNFNGLKETYFLKKDDKSWTPYLLKHGLNGVPEIVPYEIKEWPEKE